MLILNAQILESQGIPYRAASKILFQERLFIKRQTFSQRVKQVAINLYEEYVNSGIPCLLIESTEQITFWRELQPESDRPAATPGSRSPQSPVSNSFQAAKLPKLQAFKHQSSKHQLSEHQLPEHQPQDAIRIEMPFRESLWLSQKPASQKPTSQKPLTRIRRVQPSSTAVSSSKIAITPAITTPAITTPASIAPLPEPKPSTLPAHLRRLTYR